MILLFKYLNAILKSVPLFLQILLLCFLSQICIGQEENFTIPDSLKDKSYEYLFKKSINNYEDTLTSTLYLNTYLKKAIINNDKYEKSSALNYLSYYEKNKNDKLRLLKKSLKATQGLDSIYAVTSHVALGIHYHRYFEYDKALSHYLTVQELSIKYGDKNYEHIALDRIGILKKDIGKHDKALELFKKRYTYENSKTHKDSSQLAIIVLRLAESMRYNKKHDSASYYYHHYILNKIPYYHDILTLNEGINLYESGKFVASETLLLKAASELNFNDLFDRNYYILSQLYLGKLKLNYYKDSESAKTYLHRVDSLLDKTNIIIPETREVYEFFMSDYKEHKNDSAYFIMINKLLRFDSLVATRKIRMSDRLHSEFDTPGLLNNKESLIKRLENKTEKLNTRTLYLIVFVILLIGISVFQFKKHRAYKKRFNQIITGTKNKKVRSVSKNKHVLSKNITISEELIDSILGKLENFEKKKGFLKTNLKVTSLAKRFSTNTKYLSEVIKIHKGKPFVHYINDHRIDYILNELQENNILRHYTIKGIAEEAGFNTSESFAAAFKKRTGLKPSYFLKNLRK
ncbi:AraC family transcriptional regulator [Dokdonia sp.]|uniref:AraC family transcriptional regulator n=1 Tax=Dokdonia sp. TaxID=2024995 RepID=UPI0032661533